jgi:hypothetical protein
VVCWRKTRRFPALISVFSVVIVVCLFMIHPDSAWIWDRIGPLAYLQFPWRLLILISFCTSILAGAALLLVRSGKPRVILWSVLVALVAVVNVGWFRPERFLDVTQSDLLSGPGWDTLRLYAIWDFLPRSAMVAPQQPSTGAVTQVSGTSDITHVAQGSDWLRFEATSPTPAVVQLNVYDFPTWSVTLDGQPISYTHDASTGLLSVGLPAGTHTLDAHLQNTPVRTLGNLVTLIALILLAVVCLWPMAAQASVAIMRADRTRA